MALTLSLLIVTISHKPQCSVTNHISPPATVLNVSICQHQASRSWFVSNPLTISASISRFQYYQIFTFIYLFKSWSYAVGCEEEQVRIGTKNHKTTLESTSPLQSHDDQGLIVGFPLWLWNMSWLLIMLCHQIICPSIAIKWLLIPVFQELQTDASGKRWPSFQ